MMIDKTINQETCRTFPLHLATERVQNLLKEGKIHTSKFGVNASFVEAQFKDQNYRFMLKDNPEYPETPWQVFILEKKDG
jgi:hypothetical protein